MYRYNFKVSERLKLIRYIFWLWGPERGPTPPSGTFPELSRTSSDLQRPPATLKNLNKMMEWGPGTYLTRKRSKNYEIWYISQLLGPSVRRVMAKLLFGPGQAHAKLMKTIKIEGMPWELSG